MNKRLERMSHEEIQQEMTQYGHVRTDSEVTIEAAKLRYKRIGALLLSNEGRQFLDTLEDLYYKGSMLGDTPEKTYFNLGQREVVDFLLGLRDQATKEK